MRKNTRTSKTSLILKELKPVATFALTNEEVLGAVSILKHRQHEPFDTLPQLVVGHRLPPALRSSVTYLLRYDLFGSIS